MAAAGKKPPSVRKREDPGDEGGCRGMKRARWHVSEIKMAPDLGCSTRGLLSAADLINFRTNSFK